LVKLVSMVLKELRGPYVLISKSTCLELGIKRGDYVLLSINKRKTVAIVKDIIPRIATIIVSYEIAKLLNLREVDLIEVHKPVIEKARKIYVKIIEGEIDYLKLRNYLSGKVVLNNSLVDIAINGTPTKVNVLVELGDNNKLYLISYDTVIKIIKVKESFGKQTIDLNIPSYLLDSIKNVFSNIGFMLEDCSSSGKCPDFIDLRAYKIVEGFIYEIFIICRFYNNVLRKEVIDKIVHSIRKSERLPNMVVILIRDTDEHSISIAYSKGIFPIKIPVNGNSNDIEKIISSKIKDLFETLANRNSDNTGHSILTKIKNVYSGLRTLVENRSLEAET